MPEGWSLRAKLNQGHLEDFYEGLPEPEGSRNVFLMARQYLEAAIDADWFNGTPDGFVYRDADPEDIVALFHNIHTRIMGAQGVPKN